jgi:hypothetical protein
MNPKVILTISITATFFTSKAQEKDWRLYNDGADKPVERMTADDIQNNPGTVSFYMDKRIANLDSLKKLNPTGIEGYRVQIFFGDRDKAQDTRVDFLRAHPEMGAYISYLAPNFRLRVGDFRTRLESEKFKTELLQRYPGSYIVKDEIELPPLKTASAE